MSRRLLVGTTLPLGSLGQRISLKKAHLVLWGYVRGMKTYTRTFTATTRTYASCGQRIGDRFPGPFLMVFHGNAGCVRNSKPIGAALRAS